MYIVDLLSMIQTEDSYEEGEIGQSYDLPYSLQTKGKTPAAALKEMADSLGLKRSDFEVDDIPHLITSYLADDAGYQASKRDIELWKQGRKRLYNVDVKVRLEKLVPATLTEMKKALSKSNPSRRTARKRRR